jgi:hypothetical protein
MKGSDIVLTADSATAMGLISGATHSPRTACTSTLSVLLAAKRRTCLLRSGSTAEATTWAVALINVTTSLSSLRTRSRLGSQSSVSASTIALVLGDF